MAHKTSATISPPISPYAPRKNRSKMIVWSVFLVGSIALASWGLQNSPSAQERRYTRVPLDILVREQSKRHNDPVALYITGKKLNAAQRFPEADPLLRRAAELDSDDPRIRDEWTQALLGSGLATAAFQQLRQYIGTHPDLPEAHFILGKFYFTQRSMKRASEEFETCLKSDANKGEAWAYLALAREALNEIPDAIEAAKKAVESRPDNAQDHLTLATLLARANQSQEARTHFEKSVALASPSVAAKREFARWLIDTSTTQEDKQKAEQFAEEAVKQMPNDANSLLTYGRTLLLNNKREQATKILNQAAEAAPLDPAPATLLVQAYREADRKADAEKWQATATERQKASAQRAVLWEKLRASPDNSRLNRQMAWLMAQEGNVAGCVHHHARATKSATDAPPALIAAANDLTENGFARDALPLAQRAVTIGSSNPAAFEAHGNALLGLDQPELAFKEYNKAVGWLPARIPVIQKRIDAYIAYRAENPTKAETAYLLARQMLNAQVGPRRVMPKMLEQINKAITLEPGNRRYLDFLLQVQVAQRKPEDALETAGRILALVPNDTRTNAMKAVILAERAQTPDQFQEVQNLLQKAKGDEGVVATYHYATGLLALQQNRPADAAKEFRLTLGKDPDTDITYFKLAQAERLNGNPNNADEAMAQYRKRQDQKRRESAILGDIAQKPNDLERYRKAIVYLKSQGKSLQAQAVATEAVRRFGSVAKRL